MTLSSRFSYFVAAMASRGGPAAPLGTYMYPTLPWSTFRYGKHFIQYYRVARGPGAVLSPVDINHNQYVWYMGRAYGNAWVGRFYFCILFLTPKPVAGVVR